MDQIPWRTGVNMREFAYYGTPAVPHTDSGLQRRQLDQLQALQVKLVRFYASYNQFTTTQCAKKVSAALDLLQSYQMQAVVCLVDSLNSPFTLRGDGAFHIGPMGHIVKDYWHQKAYQTNFIPFATGLAQTCGQHPALLMWELGNEYAIHPQPASWDDGQAFLDFARTASQAIKTAAPQTLVSTGLVGAHHVAPAGMAEQYGKQLYGLATLDAISIHYYADDGEMLNVHREASVAKGLGKPFYVGEFGAPDNWPSRAQFYHAELQERSTDGAFTALAWAFDSSPSDVGVSDTKAFAAIRPDFDNIKNALKSFGRAVDPVVITPVKVDDKPITSQKTFVVVKGPVYIRSAPTLAPGTKTEGRWLSYEQTVEVDATSRTESEGYVWWRHQDGWSAERSLDNRLVFMVEAQPVVSGTTETVVETVTDQPSDVTTFSPTFTKTFSVINGPVSWRTAPTLEPRVLIKGKVWRTGQRVTVDAMSRTESDGYVWWQHQDGWSAERSLGTPPLVLMVEDELMLADATLFTRLPLDLDTIQWVQYFGNTTFAFEHGRENSYDSYSQGLHGGLDLAQAAGVAVRVGIRSDLNPMCTYVGNQRSFTPNRVDIQVGQYLIILGHLANPDTSLLGKSVTPDTVAGFISSEAGHVHIEIRRGNKIVNPLTLIPEALRNSLLGRFSPAHDFQPNNGQWETALDQPDIIIGGPLIGPRKAG